MNFSSTFFINASGLFDFDLTFPFEATLFLILAFVVTSSFLSPITKQLDERIEFIDVALRKSTILLTFGYETLSTCVGLLTSEVSEMNRQMKMVRTYTNSKFEEEIMGVQQENSQILSQLKGDLAIKSAHLFSELSNDLTALTEKFFAKKFQSA